MINSVGEWVGGIETLTPTMIIVFVKNEGGGKSTDLRKHKLETTRPRLHQGKRKSQGRQVADTGAILGLAYAYVYRNHLVKLTMIQIIHTRR